MNPEEMKLPKIPEIQLSEIEKILFKKEWVIDRIHPFDFVKRLREDFSIKNEAARDILLSQIKHQAELAKIEAQNSELKAKMLSEMSEILSK